MNTDRERASSNSDPPHSRAAEEPEPPVRPPDATDASPPRRRPRRRTRRRKLDLTETLLRYERRLRLVPLETLQEAMLHGDPRSVWISTFDIYDCATDVDDYMDTIQSNAIVLLKVCQDRGLTGVKGITTERRTNGMLLLEPPDDGNGIARVYCGRWNTLAPRPQPSHPILSIQPRDKAYVE